MYCERCGSIHVVRTRSSVVDRVLRLLTGRKRVTCKRCLWTARVEWVHDDGYVAMPQEPRGVDAHEPRR